MIKDLIIDIAYDKINLSQALTRSKLIARQIKNETFINWLNKELKGYNLKDKLLPDYRVIFAEITLFSEFPFGRTHKFTVTLPENFSEIIEDTIYNHRIIEPIAVIEETAEQFVDGVGYIHLDGNLLELVGSLYIKQISAQGGVIRSGQRTVGKSQFINVIELTKQKLLDILQDLDEEFPELKNKYIMTDENNEKTQNIVTTNIYGNNNPLNIVTGQGNSQNDVNLTINTEIKEKLREFGLQDEEINEIEIIDKENPKGTESRVSKIMAWTGKVSAGLAARGIYDNIPLFTEFVTTML